MLGLTATTEARAQLRALRERNPTLFNLISARINKVRKDPGGRDGGRAFLLEDGRTARLATYYDTQSSTDLCVVWLLDAVANELTVKIIWAAPFDEEDSRR